MSHLRGRGFRGRSLRSALSAVAAGSTSMLSRAHRMTRAEDFHEAVRRGSRAGSDTLVVHLSLQESSAHQPRIGLIVNKSVGTAVVRTRVKRRLRHLCRELVPTLPTGALLVVRATPASAAATSSVLAADLDSCAQRALRRARRGPAPAVTP